MTEDFITKILNDWLEFTNFEGKNENAVNLNSWNYTLMRYNEKIKNLAELYNVPSEITIIYLKNLFGWFLEKASISLKELLNESVDLSCI